MSVNPKKVVVVVAKTVVISGLALMVGLFAGGWLKLAKPASSVSPVAPPAPADDWLDIKISHDGKLISVVRSEGWVQNPQEFGRPQLADIIDRLEKVLPRAEVPATPAPSTPPASIPERPDCHGSHQHGDSSPTGEPIPIPLIPVVPLAPPRVYEGEPLPPPPNEAPTESPIDPPIILWGRPGGLSPARLTPTVLWHVPQPFIRSDGPHYPYPGIRW